MARKKEYIEEEVIKKAMHLFWRNGYETTSVRMLEKEMGINQFSMYSSFGNKQGVFLESIKFYKSNLRTELIDKLKNSNKGIEAIKEYFYNFIEFSKHNNTQKGCLLTNTVNELGEEADPIVSSEIIKFATEVRSLFVEKLKLNSNKEESMISKQANYLMVSLQGLSVASKMFGAEQLNDFIEYSFENL